MQTEKIYGDFLTKRKKTWREDGVAIKEAIDVNLKDASSESFDKAIKLGKTIEKKYGVKLLRVFLHGDEYRVDTDTGNKVFNYHAHHVFGWYDFSHHKPFSINPDEMSKIQDLTAEIMELPRGNRTGKYGRKGLTNVEFKEAMNIINLARARKDSLRKEFASIEKRLRLAYDKNNERDEVVEAFLSNPSIAAQEIDSWIVSVEHPVAFRNCVERFDKIVSILREKANHHENVKREHAYYDELNHQYEIDKLDGQIEEKQQKLAQIPSSLQSYRFVDSLRERACNEVTEILSAHFKGTFVGMERKQNKLGHYYECIEMSNNGKPYNINVLEESGKIVQVNSDGTWTNLPPIKELTEYFNSTVSPEMKAILEETYPLTNELKQKIQEKKKSNGIKIGY